MRVTLTAIFTLLAIGIQGCGSPDSPSASPVVAASITNDSTENTISAAQAELVQVQTQSPTKAQDIQNAIASLQTSLSALEGLDTSKLSQTEQMKVQSLETQLTSEINHLKATLSSIVVGGGGGVGGGGSGGSGGGAFCSFNGQTIANGGSVNAFQGASVAFGGTCQSETRTCVNGQLSGSFTFSSCTVAPGKTCALQAGYGFYGAAPFLNPKIWTNVASSADCAILCGSMNQPGGCQYRGYTDLQCAFSTQPQETIIYLAADISAGYCQ